VSAKPIKVDLGAGVEVWFYDDFSSEAIASLWIDGNYKTWLTEEQAAAIGAKRPERWWSHTVLGTPCAFHSTTADGQFIYIQWSQGSDHDVLPLSIWKHAVWVAK
jgi:hypothetical protein